MATYAYAPAMSGMLRYRRVVRLPVTGAAINGRVSLVDGDKDMVILGTVAAFGNAGLQSLTTNFGPMIPAATIGGGGGGGGNSSLVLYSAHNSY